MASPYEDVVVQVARLSARDRVLHAARAGGKTVESPPDLIQALLDAVRVLEEARAPHGLIGGLAVAIHTGLPRATQDVDLAVRSDADLEKLVAAFGKAGFQVGRRYEHTLNLRHPAGQPIQLTFDATFDSAVDRAESFDLAGHPIRLVLKKDLIEMKERAAADPRRRRSKAHRDRADLEMLRGDVPDPDEGW